MNKLFAFPGITLILLLVFACTIPSEIEITGSPVLKFAANKNLNDFFSDMLNNALNSDGKTKIVSCTNSLEYKVFLLHMVIFRKENYECRMDEGTITINNVDIPVKQIGADKKFEVLEERTIAESDEPYTRSFKGLEDYLEGFEFIGIQSKVYIYGTQLADVVSIDLYQVDTEGNETLIVSDKEITSKVPSGIESLEEYNGLALPPGGGDIDISDIINSGGDLSLKYIIYLPEGTEIDSELFDDLHTIVAEIVIWLPMTFDSVEENAKFKFPDFFDGISDVLKSLSRTGCIENMSMKIAIDPLNPFGLGDGIFIINDDSYGQIQGPLDEHSFLIIFNEEEIDYINKNPFDPNFFVLYPKKNSFLEIPNEDIMISTVSLNAEFKYNVEF